MTTAPGSAELCPLFGGRLPVHVLVNHIMSFLPYKCTYLKVANTCKGMICAMSSAEAERMWGHIVLSFCIDPSCPLCPYKRKSDRGAPSEMLRKYPIANINVHCLVSDLPVLLSSLSSRASIRSVQITLSNKSQTPVLGKLLSGTILLPTSFNQLRHLTIDSSNLTIVGLPGRMRILQAMGHHLESLILVGKSVSGIFSAIMEYCPLLKELRVDKVESESYFAKYFCASLQDLTLNRVGFMPTTLRSATPSLKRLTLTYTCRHSEAAYASFFASLPSSLEALDIELTGSMANSILRSLGQSLPQLRELKLRGAYDSGSISSEALTKLLTGCSDLWSFEASGALSAFRLRLDPLAVPSLAVGRHLTHVTLRYEDRVAEMFPTLLSQPHALTHITLWEQKKWLPETSSWTEIKARVTQVQEAHPAIKILLIDRV